MNKKVKWVGTLSTTERNHIGLIRVRQNNVNSEVLGFEIIDGNGEPYDLKNRKVLFCTYFDRFAPVEQYAEVIENGKIIYIMNEHDMQKPVRINFAYFKIMDEKDNLVDTTQNFSYDIIPSIESKCMDSEPYIIRLEEVLDAFLQINTDAKKELEQIIIDFNKQIIEQQQDFEFWFESIREILESVDPGGVILNEIVGSRKSINGYTHNNLSERLNEMEKSSYLVTTSEQFTNSNVATMFIAHRGNEGLGPENTMKAFELAYIDRFDGIETDAQISSDGIWYCFHDDTLDRMTNGTGIFTETSSTVIDSLVIDGGNGISYYPGEKVPRLEDFLKYCKRKNLYPQIELKKFNDDSNLDSFVSLIQKYGFNKNKGTILAHYSAVEKLRKKWESTFVTVTYSDAPEFDSIVRSNLPNIAIAFEYSLLVNNKQVINKYREMGIKVGSYTISNSDMFRNIEDLGLDFIGGGVKKEHGY